MDQNKTAAIITMHCPLNYGAVLQTYGLQTYIENNNVNVFIIDYNPSYIVYDQSLMHVGDERLKKFFITRWLYRIVKFPSKNHRRSLFSDFKIRELHLSERFDSYEEIAKANLNADFFICGSDQIWNSASGAYCDPAYFLKFVSDKRKRNSYAASGNLKPPFDKIITDFTIPAISELENISMRENSTIEDIQPYVSKKIHHVCDPVFLLNASQWKQLAYKKGTVRTPKNFVLVYPMGLGVEYTIDKAVELAQRAHLPLVCISPSQRRDKRISKYYNVSPYEFIQLIDKATYVVTNSFHGTSFSIILNKQFWCCNAKGSNQRIESILDICNLRERFITGKDSADPNKVIDYNGLVNDLSLYISNSKKYIKKIIL